MRRLRVIMAFERVGHRLAHGVTGLEATQEAAPVIGYSAAYNSNQFRVHWEEGKKGLPCLDFRGVCP